MIGWIKRLWARFFGKPPAFDNDAWMRQRLEAQAKRWQYAHINTPCQGYNGPPGTIRKIDWPDSETYGIWEGGDAVPMTEDFFTPANFPDAPLEAINACRKTAGYEPLPATGEAR